MVPQCTTIEPTATTPHSPSRASTPVAAARSASGSQRGSHGRPASRPVIPMPISTPNRCTRKTPAKARDASGVCSWVMTEDASWITASAIAAISNGPPSAEAATQRMTNHDDRAAAAAVVRAVAHTISSTGSSGITPSSRPPIETGTWCTPSHMLAMAPNAPVISLLAINSCSRVIAAMMPSAATDGPNATRSRSRACRVPTDRLSTSWVAPRTLVSRMPDPRCPGTRRPDYDDGGPDCGVESDCVGGVGDWVGTAVVGADDPCCCG